MGNLHKNQSGLGVIGALLVLIVIAIAVFIGLRVAQNGNDSTASTASKAESSSPPISTAGWTPYTSTTGKFSLQYPTNWATADHLELCSDGILLLGANSELVGECASDDPGQMFITWYSDRSKCGELSSEVWTQNTKEDVTVSGVKGTKIVGAAKANARGANSLPEGTPIVEYCFAHNNMTFVADYIHLSTDSNVQADFDAMVTQTLKFE